MRKNIFAPILFLLLTIFALSACKKDSEKPLEPIKIGKGATTLEQITINRNSQKILLQGGDGKFRAVVNDASIADVKVEKDSLILRGLREGKTFATVTSHDFSQRLNITVAFPELTFSQNEIKLYPDPNREERSVRLAGGGLNPQLDVQPEGVLEVKWDGSTEEVVIKALRVGDAVITAKDDASREAMLSVKVRPDDEPEQYGVYGNNKRYLGQNFRLKPVLVSETPNGNIIMASGASPKGGSFSTGYPTTVISIMLSDVMTVTGYPIYVTHVAGSEIVPSGTYECDIEPTEGKGLYLINDKFIFYLPNRSR